MVVDRQKDRQSLLIIEELRSKKVWPLPLKLFFRGGQKTFRALHAQIRQISDFFGRVECLPPAPPGKILYQLLPPSDKTDYATCIGCILQQLQGVQFNMAFYSSYRVSSIIWHFTAATGWPVYHGFLQQLYRVSSLTWHFTAAIQGDQFNMAFYSSYRVPSLTWHFTAATGWPVQHGILQQLQGDQFNMAFYSSYPARQRPTNHIL